MRAHNLPFSSEIIILPSFPFCIDILLFASSRIIDLSGNIIPIRDPLFVYIAVFSRGRVILFSRSRSQELPLINAFPIFPENSIFRVESVFSGVLFEVTTSTGIFLEEKYVYQKYPAQVKNRQANITRRIH